MSRFPIIGFLFPLYAWGQFNGLATPADGSRVQFATPLVQKNTSQPAWGKLFQIDSSGLQLVLARQEQPPVVTGAVMATNPYNIQAADLSADGTVSAVSALLSCTECSGGYERAVTTIITPAGQHDYTGNLRLSANGRWAFGRGTSVYAGGGDMFLVDVAAGKETEPTIGDVYAPMLQVSTSGRVVANDSTFVAFNFGTLYIGRPSGLQQIQLAGQNDFVGDAVIAAAADTIVYSDCANASTYPGVVEVGCGVPGYQKLYVTDRVSIRLLVSDGRAPSLSDDGSLVLYLSNVDGQAHLIQTDGTGDRVLTSETAGLSAAILSGDGLTAYAVTGDARMLKITVATGAVQEIIPRTPYLTLSGALAPGNFTTISGVGLSDGSYGATYPLPFTLGGLEVDIQGIPTRLVDVTPTTITLVVPPNVVPTQNGLDLTLVALDDPSASPFAPGGFSSFISSFEPFFLYGSSNGAGILVAHQDWSGLVTAASPAHPGEILYAYASGLGPTSPAVPYGVAAPSSEPLARLVTPFQCSDNAGGPQVFYQGLAPGYAGVYQVDFQVPASAAAGTYSFTCTLYGIYTPMYAAIPIASAP